MINIRFITTHSTLTGFEMNGHSGYSESGSDIVCAAVSSAAYMTANTVTDVLGIDADISVSDGFMMMKLSAKDAQIAQDILRGFEIHVCELSEQYKSNISVIYSEV
ncbi:MAG: ribosomal-processing cysteine protease Prp [Clostridia bacterium]|nr:ribosomal-processing cysteine protease Prp [Clostridia bacterium]